MGVKNSKGPVRFKSTIRSFPATIMIADLKNVILAPSKEKQSSDPCLQRPSRLRLQTSERKRIEAETRDQYPEASHSSPDQSSAPKDMVANMKDLKPLARTIIQNNALLLRTGKFSDLTLVPRGREFLVHQAIVCPRSPVWASAVNGGFTSSTTKVIEVEVVDADALQRALHYLYTGSYKDEQLSSNEHLASAPMTDVCKLDSRTQPDSVGGDEIAEPKVNPLQSGEQCVPPPPYEKLAPIVRNSEPSADQHKCLFAGKDESDYVCAGAQMRTDRMIYILADCYQIPDLKTLAAEKFETRLMKICQHCLGEDCRLVYGSTPSTAVELRSSLSRAIARHGRHLVRDPAFMEPLSPELLRNAFKLAVQQRHDARTARDAAVVTALQAQKALEKAHQKVKNKPA